MRAMARDTSSRQSRRALLAGASGAVAAIGLAALANPTLAAQDDPLLAGNVVTDAQNSTGVSTSGGNGLQGTTSDSSSSGVYGENSNGGYGVAGRSYGEQGTGVYGEGQTGAVGV